MQETQPMKSVSNVKINAVEILPLHKGKGAIPAW
jgi:hypothetical protein